MRGTIGSPTFPATGPGTFPATWTNAHGASFNPLDYDQILYLQSDLGVLKVGGSPAGNGDPIPTWENQSTADTPASNATQTTANNQPVFNSPSVDFDGVDDFFNVTLSEDRVGTIIVATTQGTYVSGIDIASGVQTLSAKGFSTNYARIDANDVVGVYLGPELTSQEAASVVNYFVSLGAVESFAGVSDFSSAWRDCSSLTSFPLIDTSSGTGFYSAWYGCSSLTSFPLIDTSSGINFGITWRDCSSLTSFPLIDTSSGTNFSFAWRDCSSLTSFPAGMFDSWSPSSVASNCFVSAWRNCTSLTSQSVENILVSIDTSGQHGPASGNDITIDYDGSGLTGATTTAITSLKTKGWTITIDGVLQ